MPQINSGLKKCNLGIILLVLGLIILAISLFIPINFFVSMITGLTLMLISLVRFIKNICSECGIVIDDNDIPSCPGCGVDFNWFIWATVFFHRRFFSMKCNGQYSFMQELFMKYLLPVFILICVFEVVQAQCWIDDRPWFTAICT